MVGPLPARMCSTASFIARFTASGSMPSARPLGTLQSGQRAERGGEGMDPLAVNLAMNEAVEHMRAGNGTTIVEADLYRFFHQNGPYPGSAFGYRDKAEEESWRERDPLEMLIKNVVRRKLATTAQIDGARDAVLGVMREIGDSILEPCLLYTSPSPRDGL